MAAVYVETSVWSHAFAEDAPEKRADTLRFLDAARSGAHDLFISGVVLDEVGRADEELQAKLRGLIAQHGPRLLDFTEDADDLAQRFLELGALLPSKIEDAQHVAIATVNELDALLSWNYRHLVNVRRRQALQHISALCGYYKPLQIVTPPEVSYERE